MTPAPGANASSFYRPPLVSLIHHPRAQLGGFGRDFFAQALLAQQKAPREITAMQQGKDGDCFALENRQPVVEHLDGLPGGGRMADLAQTLRVSILTEILNNK